MKLLSIIGARPQFIKLSPLCKALEQYPDIKHIIVHTGQHFDANMSDVFFRQMGMPHPDYYLNINQLSHGAMTGRMMEAIEKILIDQKPDCVIVFGDTNSTLAGALAASKLHIKIAHIEAGLRSFNMAMPEEINRILTDRISNFLFCPTTVAIQNLNNEGFSAFGCQIFQTGDIMFDAALLFASQAVNPIPQHKHLFVLATIHRQESTDNLDNLKNIFTALEKIARHTSVVIPLHPRTRKIIDNMPAEQRPSFDNMLVIEPVGYLEMLYLLQHCQIVLTDSGGVQKESYFFKKSCLILRTETEWLELVEAGINYVCATNPDTIIANYHKAMTTPKRFDTNIYGTGKSAHTIIEHLLQSL